MRWLSVASSASFCTRDVHKCLMPLCIGAFPIIFLRNERLLIAFLVRLICYMVLPHYCAVHLKEMYFNFTAYIFLYKYITCFPWMYFTTIQRAIYLLFFTRFSPTLIHFSLFPNIFIALILDFIKLCTHDFYRVTFASELSTNCTSYCFALFVLHILLLFLFFFTIYMLLCCVTFI